ncbi:MAG: CRTAC1 family protein [Bacteroidota bacterium]
MKLLISILLAFGLVPQLFSQKFKEVSFEMGLDYIYPGTDHQEIGAGVIVFDINNDGWDDIFQCGGTFPSKLWLNQEGKFTDVTKEYQIGFLQNLYVQGASAADVDNDGYEDLFIANKGTLEIRGDNCTPVFLKNMGGKYFKEMHQDVFNIIGDYAGCVWGDVNNDGFVDLYLLNYVFYMGNDSDSLGQNTSYNPECLPNRFYINQQGKGFVETTAEWNLEDDGCGLAACFTDYDNDNDIDLMLLNDFGHFNHKGNRIFRNDYPAKGFTDFTDSLGFYREFYGMGVGPGDYDNNGTLDYYLTNIGRNYFFKNSISSFTEEAVQMKIDIEMATPTQKGTSWSGLFFDMENDADVDLYITKGYLESLERAVTKDENVLFENVSSSSFKNISKLSGLNDSLAQRGAAFIDFNHDGKLDIVTNEVKLSRGDFAKTDQKIKLFNNLSKAKNRWIAIKLVGSGTVNRSAVGSSVTLLAGDKIQMREVDGGSGHSSQSSKTLYFGLGKNKFASNITIQWLGGETRTIEKLKAGKVYEIKY